jgi:uncharacterized protein YigA (DUF484 family)
MAEMTLKDGLQAMDVAEYLRRHPQFLEDFPELAMMLTLPREQGPVASLASYQLDVLRQKNRELERRLSELYEVAGENEQLMVHVHSLSVSLLRARSLEEAVRSVTAGLTEDFHTDLVRLLLFRDGTDLPQEADWLILEPGGADTLPVFAEFLARQEPLVGRLAADKLEYLFGEHADEVHSAVLMRLGDVGMLAIGSGNANRFHPGIGTVFLKLISEAVTAALSRFPPRA